MKQPKHFRGVLLSLLFVVVGFRAPYCLAETLTNLHATPGFTVEKVAGPPETIFPMFATFDDRGRLFVAESSGLDLYAALTTLTRKWRVKMLVGRDGDGV